MFTGIIEHLGKVKQIKRQANSAVIVVDIAQMSKDVNSGDSIAINGACLTVTHIKGSEVSFDVSTETLSKTTIGELKPSDRVNVESSLRIGDKLGGHFVTGHVDGVGANMMIKKGSVAVDGISLTIVDLEEKSFSVALIPYTLEETSLGFKKVGQKVNIETDMLGKWVKRILVTDDKAVSGITEEMLKEKGFL